jgi:hypothetical protein
VILALGAATIVGGLSMTITLAVLIVLLPVASRMPADIVSVLVIFVYVLLLVPARLRISPLGAGGTPASLVGAAAFGIWLYGWALGKPWLRREPNPLRLALLGVAVAIMASYVVMGWRAHDELEAKAADRGLFTLVSMAGVALLAMDGIQNRASLRRLLHSIVLGGTALSALGIIQFFTSVDLAARIRIPGFTYVASDYASERSGFNRIVSTTSHPIEMSVVVALLLPMALHLGLTAPAAERRKWWICAAVIGISAPLTVSRTAVIALAVGALILFPAWPRRHRKKMLLALLAGTVAMKFAVPGLLGTLRSFLFDASNDPSVVSRQEGADYVSRFISERPLLGRGFGTFLPTRYEYLDNQVLLALVEIGIVGLLAFVVLLVLAVGLTRIVRLLSPRADDRDLAQTLFACMAVGFITWFTYDALGFPTSRTLVFLAIGMAGALWQIVRAEFPLERNPRYRSPGRLPWQFHRNSDGPGPLAGPGRQVVVR